MSKLLLTLLILLAAMLLSGTAMANDLTLLSVRDTDGGLITYQGQAKTKNDWVFTGRDSLFQTLGS